MEGRNPFTPNFGQVPMFIAGRKQIIGEIELAMESEPGNPAQTSVLIGARGTGKTSLLSYFSQECKSRGWVSVNTNCIKGMKEDIYQQALVVCSEFLPEKKGKRIKGLTLGNIVSVEFETQKNSGTNWRTKMTRVLEELEETGTGLLITIDEIDPSMEEMIEIASVYQLWVREGRKVSLIMAGLPSAVFSLVDSKNVSFLRRASQYTLGHIEDYEIEEAFTKTIKHSGKDIRPGAVKKALEAIEGFPYMLQLVGYRTWDAAEETIDDKAVETGIRLAKKDFESRVITATIRELSDGDKAFLKAMTEDEKESAVSSIVKRLNKTSGYVSRYRGRLLERGVIESLSRGKVSFAIPGIKEYLKEQE